MRVKSNSKITTTMKIIIQEKNSIKYPKPERCKINLNWEND